MRKSTREPPVDTELSVHFRSHRRGCGLVAWLGALLSALGIAVTWALAKGLI